ncbi:MAG: hypothetical protein ACLFTT_00930 [Candidatus Hydrogenedentota bacterium]
MLFIVRAHFAVMLTIPLFFAGASEENGGHSHGFKNVRHVYERGAPCVLDFTAPEASAVDFDISGMLGRSVPVEDGVASYTIDTALLGSGDYIVRALPRRGNGAKEAVRFPVTIAPPHDSERLSVWRWGGGGADPAWWMQRGFTGAFYGSQRDPLTSGSSRAHSLHKVLERAGRHDFELGFYMYPLLSKKLAEQNRLLCLYPNGTRQTDKPKPYPREPEVIDHARATVASAMARFQDYPGLRHVMLHSEWQTPYCVNETAVSLAEEEAALDLREFVENRGSLAAPPADMVQDGIIADDNAHYQFRLWWWQRGHGTAVLNALLHEIVKEHNPNIVTWHEPYRLAPVHGSHTGLDCIATWTYGHPDIKRLCYTTYLQAAARPENQLVQQDISLFVYGRFVVPLDESTADLANDFAGRDPFYTAGPDYAREAMWLVLSQRPDILCFYSAGRLAPDDPENDPFYASPDTFSAIGQTCEDLVKPYGPALLKCRRVPARTAVLMSAASTWFSDSARLPGYPNEQTLPFATLLMMNHVPFEVVLDEDITRDALDRYDVLVMPRADTLTRTMYERIRAFAGNGGKVIADDSLRASVPEAEITQFDFTHQKRMDGRALAAGNAVTAEENRRIMEEYANKLAPMLADVSRPAEAGSPRVLTNSLEGGAARYHFFVNDDRTYGPRFGEHELFFELGVPQTAAVRVPIDGRPALYDALLRTPVDYETKAGHAEFDIRMTGAAGKLIIALPEKLVAVSLDMPESTPAGENVRLDIRVLGESGDTLQCVVPLHIEVLDGLGRSTDWQRYTATKKGARTYEFTPAVNAAHGDWTIRVTELVSGQRREETLRVINGA